MYDGYIKNFTVTWIQDVTSRENKDKELPSNCIHSREVLLSAESYRNDSQDFLQQANNFCKKKMDRHPYISSIAYLWWRPVDAHTLYAYSVASPKETSFYRIRMTPCVVVWLSSLNMKAI